MILGVHHNELVNKRRSYIGDRRHSEWVTFKNVSGKVCIKICRILIVFFVLKYKIFIYYFIIKFILYLNKIITTNNSLNYLHILTSNKILLFYFHSLISFITFMIG